MKMKSADEQLLDNVSSMLTKNKLKIASAESCTGGLIAHSLTNISGSSDFFECGVVFFPHWAGLSFLPSIREGRIPKTNPGNPVDPV